MSVTGVVMISSPGSGLTAPTAAWMAPVPESVETAYLTPCSRAKVSSTCSTLLAAPQPPSIALSTTSSTCRRSSSSKNHRAPKGFVRTGSPPCIASFSATLPVALSFLFSPAASSGL